MAKLTKEIVDKVVSLRKEGKSIVAIEKEVGISGGSVYRIIHNTGNLVRKYSRKAAEPTSKDVTK